METDAERPFGLAPFLRRELSLRPGRAAAIARIAVSCTLVVIVWMVFQIPAPAYAVYIVFLVSGSDAAASMITGVAGVVAATLAIGLSILLYAFAASEPALRVPLIALSTFLGMWLSRTIAAGPVAFLLGFLLVITQTLADVIPNPEALTRFLLWLWLVVAGPAIFTVLVNLWIGPNPAKLLRSSAVTLLDAVARSLQERDPTPLRAQAISATELLGLRKRASVLNRGLRVMDEIDRDLIETLDVLVQLASTLPVSVSQDARAPLLAACIACRNAVAMNMKPLACSPWPPDQVLERLDSSSRPLVIALVTLLDRLQSELLQRAVPASLQIRAREPRFLFVPDAFSNRDHTRFALKATLAATTTYLLYTGLDWPDIRTALITCFFVAMSSTGQTVHKLSLRLSGALVGGLLGGLTIVYLLPHMTDIGELALLMCAAAALFAWVSTSSELLAYAGMQMAMAFFLGLLQDFGPVTDLTVLRDRVIGIMLGNVVMSIVFSVVWPVRAGAQARLAMASALRSLSQLLHNCGQRPLVGSQLEVTTAIDQARQFSEVVAFEAPLLPDSSSRDAPERRSIDAIEEIARAAFVVVNHPSSVLTTSQALCDDVADWLADSASHWIDGGLAGAAAGAPAIQPLLEQPLASFPLYQRSALEAQAAMRRKIASVAAYVS